VHQFANSISLPDTGHSRLSAWVKVAGKRLMIVATPDIRRAALAVGHYQFASKIPFPNLAAGFRWLEH